MTPAIPATSRPASVRRAIDEAVGAAWLAHHDRLYATVLRSTRDPELAADIAAEAFEALVREAHAGRYPDNEAAWLHRVAHNRVIDWARHRARWAGHVLPAEGIEDDPATSALRREQAEELGRALECLPEAGRRAVILEGQGYRPAEIAPLLGRTNQATRTLLCRARRRMARELGTAAVA
jgi:RNA polymerase sigma factor (sigma-70 family)